MNTTSLRVAYVLKKFPRLSETFVLSEILGVEAAEIEVSVFTHRPPDEEVRHEDLARVRATVTCLPAFSSAGALAAFKALRDIAKSGDRLDGALDFLALLPENRRAELLVQALVLSRNFADLGITHAHAHFMTVASHLVHLAHLLTGIPYSVTAHAKDIYRTGVDRQVFRRVAAGARTIVTVCDANARFIQVELLDGTAARIRRIYNGLPLAEIAPASSASEKGLVIAVGRLVEKKGLHVLLAACRLLLDRGRRFRCVIVGDGEERARLLALRVDLGLQDIVSFAGALPRHETLDWMRRAEVLATPCVTGADGNQDALPTVLIEALALGLPSVSTPVAGIPEIVEHEGQGLIVPENDAPALAAALARLLDDPELRTRLGNAGRPRALGRFDRDRTLPELLGIFRGTQAAGAATAS